MVDKMLKKILWNGFLFVSFMLVLSPSSFCQTIEIKKEIGDIIYSEQYKQPVVITYTVTCYDGKESRYGMDFKKNDGINTSTDEDYVNNVWDKGHMIPAASFSCDKKLLEETFGYVNCSLQHMSLNRGAWKQLEEIERQLVFFMDSVNVEIICHFSENSLHLPSGATVPDGYTKILRLKDEEWCFYFPNKDTSGLKWFEFKID